MARREVGHETPEHKAMKEINRTHTVVHSSLSLPATMGSGYPHKRAALPPFSGKPITTKDHGCGTGGTPRTVLQVSHGHTRNRGRIDGDLKVWYTVKDVAVHFVASERTNNQMSKAKDGSRNQPSNLKPPLDPHIRHCRPVSDEAKPRPTAPCSFSSWNESESSGPYRSTLGGEFYHLSL